jgi:hypothetical protein
MKTLHVIHYQDDYPIPVIEGVSTNKLWDWFEQSENLNDDEILIKEEFQKRGYYKKFNYNDIEEFIKNHGDPDHLYITRIDIQEEILDDWIKTFSEYLKNESDNVGGDDSYYDYFPDIVNIFNNICVELDKKEIYNETLRYMKENRYSDDDENTLGDEI